jgi:hypothetical protein
MPFPTLLHDPRNRVPVLLSLLPPALVLAWPCWISVALGLWWLGNTVSHQAVHRRFWKHAVGECAWSLWLSLCLGVPQRLWRQLHLAHHAGRRWRLRSDAQLGLELGVLALVWGTLALVAPEALVACYLPGLAAGLVLRALHGHGEHVGGTTSVYARWWNTLFLNDGYHVEHHRAPGQHFRDLPRQRLRAARTSRLPPVLRGCGGVPSLLGALERLVLRCAWLRAAVLASHRRAIGEVLATVPEPARVLVVGGGLFPRSAILLRERWPRAQIVALDAERAHLELARPYLPQDVVLQHGTFHPGQRVEADLVVLPLALRGDKRVCESAPPCPLLLVHDWLWQRPGQGAVVAWWLCKRLYLVSACNVPAVLPA